MCDTDTATRALFRDAHKAVRGTQKPLATHDPNAPSEPESSEVCGHTARRQPISTDLMVRHRGDYKPNFELCRTAAKHSVTTLRAAALSPIRVCFPPISLRACKGAQFKHALRRIWNCDRGLQGEFRKQSCVDRAYGVPCWAQASDEVSLAPVQRHGAQVIVSPTGTPCFMSCRGLSRNHRSSHVGSEPSQTVLKSIDDHHRRHAFPPRRPSRR